MDNHPIMKCGCAAQGMMKARGGVVIDPPIPSCVIHDCTEIAGSEPDLTGRIAECSYLPKHHADKPSNRELPFFEYRDGIARGRRTARSQECSWPQAFNSCARIGSNYISPGNRPLRKCLRLHQRFFLLRRIFAEW